MTDRLLTVVEAAERLGTSPRFVRRLVFERRIAFVKVGRHVRITSADLDAFIAAGRVTALRRRLADDQAGASGVRIGAAAVVGSLAGPLSRPVGCPAHRAAHLQPARPTRLAIWRWSRPTCTGEPGLIPS